MAGVDHDRLYTLWYACPVRKRGLEVGEKCPQHGQVCVTDGKQEWLEEGNADAQAAAETP